MCKCLYIDDLKCPYGKKPIPVDMDKLTHNRLSRKERLINFTRCALFDADRYCCVPPDIVGAVATTGCHSFVSYARQAAFPTINRNSLKDTLLHLEFGSLNVTNIKRFMMYDAVYSLPSPCIIFSVNDGIVDKHLNSPQLKTFLDWKSDDIPISEFREHLTKICKSKFFFTHTFIYLGNGIGGGCNHPTSLPELKNGFLNLHKDLLYEGNRWKYRGDNNFQRLYYVEIPY